MPKLLLVEDNEYNRDMLMRRLNKKGYDVVVAVDGGEGVAKARAERPDLILMDMHLPVLDGWEATRQLKESDDTRTIPIIALTADAMAGDRERYLAKGFDGHLSKPIVPSALVEALADAVQGLETPAGRAVA